MRQPPHRVEIRHEGLNEYKLIEHRDAYVAQQKAQAQVAKWDEQWAKRLRAESSAKSKEDKKNLASRRTADAQKALSDLSSCLVDGIRDCQPFNWHTLKDLTPFSKPLPVVSEPTKKPPASLPLHPRYVEPELRFIDKIIKSKLEKKRAEATNTYNQVVASWEKQVKLIELQNAQSEQDYITKKREHAGLVRKLSIEWENERKNFYAEKSRQHLEIDQFEAAFNRSESEAVEKFFEMILSQSRYPDSFPREQVAHYTKEGGILGIELRMPAPEDLPKTKEIKYVAASDQMTQTQISDTAFSALYDSVLYQHVLRTIYEVFFYDRNDAVNVLAINGWVHSVDASSGKVIEPCILSIVVNRESLADIDLTKVDPKACFRKLKGVSASKLVGLAAVAPIMSLDRNDSRFVSSYEVAGGLNEQTNLAAMHWEDFEHLVRELFEKIYSAKGGEVKVTQASRDGGVDAVVFDPDPISGGKIVIQAKRYTNVVGVSAVRDLYGTVMNEGAMKGILVTTSQYGPDAYEFASGKPLTLLNGQNLLKMLSDHGYRATINLAEARKQLAGEK